MASKPRRSRSSKKVSSKSGTVKSAASKPAAVKAEAPAAASQMLISYVPGEECRVAVIEHGQLEELHVENAKSISRVGNIYAGVVTNVEPAIQAAFIDFGIGEHGFLHISDVHPKYFPGEDEDDATESIGRKTPRRDRPPIQKCFKRGDQVEVQVIKEGVGTKGPTVTSYLSIPGRFLVMMPQMDKVGVSRKVEDEDQRREMRKILDQLDLPENFGFILRTAGMDRTKLELKRDLAYLQRLWKDMEQRKSVGGKPRLLYSESDLLVRALRDILSTDVEEIIIDHELALRRAARFLKIVAPRSKVRLLQYEGAAPLYHAFGIERQIAQIHAREVPLPSGGRLVIDEAEALVAIDVNSGKSRESRDAETNAYQTNLEAIDVICRQLKLRDLGGIVVNDLIDMRLASHRKDVEAKFLQRLKRDRAKTTLAPISPFGTLEMTRQRMRGSHERVHFADCPHCHGRGLLQRAESVAGDAMRDLAALLDQPRVKKVEMVVAARVAGELLSSKRKALTILERKSGKAVDVRVSEATAPDRVTFYAYDDQGDIDLERLPAMRPPTGLKEWEFGGKEAEGEDDAGISGDLVAEAPAEPELSELSESEAAELAEPHPIELDHELEDMDEAHDTQAGHGSGAAHLGGQSNGGGAGGPNGEGGEGGRRRRRRRRGRGRGGAGGGPGGPGEGEGFDGSVGGDRRPMAGHAPGPSVNQPVAQLPRPMGQSAGQPIGQQGAPSTGGMGGMGPASVEGGEAGEGGRRRRRRRRRGRGNREGGEMNGGPGTGGGDSGRVGGNFPAPISALDAELRPRGDSWDFDPAELDRLRAERGLPPLRAAIDDRGQDDGLDAQGDGGFDDQGGTQPGDHYDDRAEVQPDDQGDPRAGDRVNQPAAFDDQSGSPADDAGGEMGDQPVDGASDGNGEGPVGAPGEGGRRRRRRRRGRVNRESGEAEAGAEGGDAMPAERPVSEQPVSAPPRPVAPPAERGPRSGGGYQKRAPLPEPKPQAPAPKPAPRPAVSAPTPAPAVSKPEAAAAGGDPKPKRFLYAAMKRKVSPADAAKQQRRD